MNAKQKKNLRKKLQRQRKKAEKLNDSQIQSQASSVDPNEGKDDGSDIENKDIDQIGDIDIEIGDKPTSKDDDQAKMEKKSEEKSQSEAKEENLMKKSWSRYAIWVMVAGRIITLLLRFRRGNIVRQRSL